MTVISITIIVIIMVATIIAMFTLISVAIIGC